MLHHRYTEEDDVPLGQYLYSHNAKIMQYQQQQQLQQQQMMQQYYMRYFRPVVNQVKPIIIPQYRRPSYPITPTYPATPSSLLDTNSDDDEDDEDLVPIAVLQSPQRTQFQSAAEKYKEKVKAQLYQDKQEDDDEVPLSQSKFNSILI